MAFEGHEPMAHMSPKKAGSRRSATQQAHLFLNVLETPSKQCGVTTARNTPRVLAGENTRTFLRSSFPFLERNIRADHIFLRPGPSKCTLVSRFCWPGPAHHIWPYLAISHHQWLTMVDLHNPTESMELTLSLCARVAFTNPSFSAASRWAWARSPIPSHDSVARFFITIASTSESS